MTAVTAATVIAGVGAAASVAGTVGGMMGGGSRAGAQRQSAADTYQAAVLRNQQLEMQAEEIRNQAAQRDNQAKIQASQAHLQQGQADLILRDVEFRDIEATLGHRAATATRQHASDQQAVAQRVAIESKRKAGNAAGRAKAVMAASGAGVDTNVLADILGEGDYAADVAVYEGNARARDLKTEADLLDYGADVTAYGANVQRYNKAVADWGVALSVHGVDNTRYQAELDRRTAGNMEWLGDTVMAQGARGAASLYDAADRTESMSYLTGGINALSLAAKYAPSFMSGGSNYSLSRDTARTANDADLGGYSSRVA
jgi:hypothetical protein